MSNREKLVGVWAVLFLGLFCVRCAQSDGYRYSLRGDIEGIKYGKAYLMTPDLNNPIIVDSSEIEDGKFLLEGTLDEPGQYVLSVNRRSFYFFMDGTKMDIVCPYEKLGNDYLKGSPSNDLDIAYNKLMQQEVNTEQGRLLNEYGQALEANDQKLSDDLMTEVLKLGDKKYALTKDFIQKHPDRLFSAYIANVVKEDSYERGSELYNLLTDDIKMSYLGKNLKRDVDALAVSALGVPCPDFQVKDEEGNIVTLASLKGKMLVLDFWASWCGPCRQEMKNLREQYAEFKDRGLQIMSISLDDSEEKWRQACEEEQIPWISTRDENGWSKSEIRKLFGIQAIPFIVLIDEDGNIVAKNIRRNLLREKIIELLNKDK